LEGKYEPRDNTERLALLGVSRFKNRTFASARLYADAFAADATLADDPRFSHRYNAARSAALAGCGYGEDAVNLAEAERKRWRDQARQWLRTELAAGARTLDADRRTARAAVRMALTQWQMNPTWRACANRSSWTSCPRTNARNASRFGPTWPPSLLALRNNGPLRWRYFFRP